VDTPPVVPHVDLAVALHAALAVVVASTVEAVATVVAADADK
jgi:hypothetical protein